MAAQWLREHAIPSGCAEGKKDLVKISAETCHHKSAFLLALLKINFRHFRGDIIQ